MKGICGYNPTIQCNMSLFDTCCVDRVFCLFVCVCVFVFVCVGLCAVLLPTAIGFCVIW
jgi:hypothetical protein